MRLAAIQALRMTVKVPDRAKVKGAGTSAIVDLVGFREENVLPVAAFYGRGDTIVNYLAEVKCRGVQTRFRGDAQLTLVVYRRGMYAPPSIVSESLLICACHTQLTTDRSVSVRTETTAMLGDWLTSLPDRYSTWKRRSP